MSAGRRYLKNLSATGLGYLVNAVAMILLSPFVIHTLGDRAYGIWTVLWAVTSYIGLMDIGLRRALARHVSYEIGRSRVGRVASLMSTALAVVFALAIPLTAAALAARALLPVLLPELTAAELRQGRTILGILAACVWLMLLADALRMLLVGRERFDVLAGIDVAAVLVRVVLTVAVLVAGGGLVGLALAQLAGDVVRTSAAVISVRLIHGPVGLAMRRVRTAVLRRLYGFGVWEFLDALGHRLIFAADFLVIGWFFGPASATIYWVASTLIARSDDLLRLVGVVFAPRLTKDWARGDLASLRRTLRAGTQVVVALGLLVVTGLVVFGREFIGLWMGEGRFLRAGGVLGILAISQMPAFAAMVYPHLCAAIGRVRFRAIVTLAHGACNLGLTLLLVGVMGMGLEGVAWGTFIPRVVFSALLAVVAGRWIGQRVSLFLRQDLWRWLVSAAVVAGWSLLVAGVLPAGSWGWFGTRVLLVVVAWLVASVMVLLDVDARRRLLRAVRPGSREPAGQVQIATEDRSDPRNADVPGVDGRSIEEGTQLALPNEISAGRMESTYR